MTTTLVDSIALLVTHDAERPQRENAALVIENGQVAWVGDSADAPAADERVDAGGGCGRSWSLAPAGHPGAWPMGCGGAARRRARLEFFSIEVNRKKTLAS